MISRPPLGFVCFAEFCAQDDLFSVCHVLQLLVKLAAAKEVLLNRHHGDVGHGVLTADHGRLRLAFPRCRHPTR